MSPSAPATRTVTASSPAATIVPVTRRSSAVTSASRMATSLPISRWKWAGVRSDRSTPGLVTSSV